MSFGQIITIVLLSLLINPAARVIMTSGFLEDPRIQQVLDNGANDFIQKP